MKLLSCVFSVFIFLLSGCGQHTPPLHSQTPVQRPANPLIIIPGTSASKLEKKDGGSVWGRRRNFVQIRERTDMALPIEHTDLSKNRDNVVPGEVFDKIQVVPIFLEWDTYKSFLTRLEREAGYQLGDIKNPKPGDSLFVFTYDWRRDNVEHAQALARKIDNLKAFYGDPGLRFDIVAHCNAGYVARYYALYGGVDVLGRENPQPTYAGAENINRLFFMGIPHGGTVLALEILHQGVRPAPLFFVRKLSRYEAFTMPGFYQLLPPPWVQALITPDGKDPGLNLYDPEVWFRHGWSVFGEEEKKRLAKQLQRWYPWGWEKVMEKEMEKRKRFFTAALKRAEDLHRAIDESKFPVTREVPAYSFLLSWAPTLELAEFNPKTGGLRFKGRSNRELRYVGGDQVLTMNSMRGNYPDSLRPREMMVHVRHRYASTDTNLQDQLMKVLLLETPPRPVRPLAGKLSPSV